MGRDGDLASATTPYVRPSVRLTDELDRTAAAGHWKGAQRFLSLFSSLDRNGKRDEQQEIRKERISLIAPRHKICPNESFCFEFVSFPCGNDRCEGAHAAK